jgi:hypothetical protein
VIAFLLEKINKKGFVFFQDVLTIWFECRFFVFQSADFVFSLRSLLLGNFYLKGIGSGPLIRRNNIFLFFFVGFVYLTNGSKRTLK